MAYLAGKKVLITGASSGIGAHLARELTRRGAQVGLIARREDRLRELAEELKSAGARAAWAAADVQDEAALCTALDQVAAELGGADVVIANAGYSRLETARNFKPGRAANLYRVNLFGTLHLIDWALPRFLEQGSGHVVGVASVASYLGFANFTSYCGSKAAMRVHLQSLRITMKRKNIAVTTICPGFVESELTADFKFPMPFLWPTDRAVRVIADAIEKKKAEVVFPWQWKVLIGLAIRLPRGVVEWGLGRRG